MDRRHFLALSTAATLAACKPPHEETGSDGPGPTSPPRIIEPDEWEPEGEVDLVVFAWGIQTGDARPDAVEVSIRCNEETLTLVLVKADGRTWVAEREVVLACEHRARTTLSDLSPDTAYRLVAYLGEGAGEIRSEVARFRTALASGQDRIVVFGVTSCISKANAPWPNLIHMGGHQLDFLGLLGDTIYADHSGFSATTLEQYREVYDDAYPIEGLYEALRHTSSIATWDDHEVYNNWNEADLPQAQIDAAREAFLEGLPQTSGPTGAMWRSLGWGAVLDVFVLDSRGERVYGTDQYLSAEQEQWFIDGLKASTARFKLIFNSVPITDFSDVLGTAEADDRWSGFEVQRTRILKAIDDAGIEGVVWLAGDLHFAAVTWVGKTGEVGASQPEVLCGPSGSRLNPVGALYVGDRTQFPILLSEWNWVRFEANAARGTLQLQFIGDDASVLEETTLAL